jgi:hypothetical protein
VQHRASKKYKDAGGVMNNQCVCIDFRARRIETYSKYFEDSKTIMLKNGYEIEFIEYPNMKYLKPHLRENIIFEMGRILLKAFGKTMDDGKELIEGDRIPELTINSHYLVIGRKNGIPISFHSGSMIDPLLYYSRATFVDPEHQQSGLGLLSIFLTMQKLYFLCGGDDLRLVTRTRNYMVARMVENGSIEYKISTEKWLDESARKVFLKTALFLDNQIDPESGIVKNVYLPGIPQGPRPKDERIRTAMDVLGPLDACYIMGIPNQRRIKMVLDKCFVVPEEQKPRLVAVA